MGNEKVSYSENARWGAGEMWMSGYAKGKGFVLKLVLRGCFHIK